ncbi:efflux RND transporter periplasmic adaptor subunit [Mariniblastus sp.]|nr:efflux RND transporter periplasmic adaptor subunit [Mariniblastus sp.]
MFAMIGLLVLAIYFLRARSSLSIGNSALVGNHLPVNVKVEGEIVEMLVAEGDTVKEGDVLMRLNNPTMQVAKSQLTSQLETAKVKIKTLKKQLKNSEKRVAIAGEKLALDLLVAESEKEAAANFLEAAKINFDRMKPAVDSGAITTLEFEVVRQELLAAEANKMATENAVKQIEFAQASIKDNILIMGDRFDDENGRLTAELEIAEAEHREAQSALAAVSDQFANLNVTAPRDGTVYVVYRHVGEFVKMADETVGISFKGKVWAAGQVTASQSRRVRPGQPVTVSAPSLGKKFEGVVSAVGHRAMYSQGHYTADFRGETATDVPVKVVIQDLPKDVPSGIRLEMAINTGFGVDWLDRTLGYSLRSVSDGQPIDDQPEDKADQPDSKATKDLIGKDVAEL